MLVGIPPPLRRVSMTVGPVQQMDRGGTRQARAAAHHPTPFLQPPQPPRTAEQVNEPNLTVTRQEAGAVKMLSCSNLSDNHISSPMKI